MLGTRDTQGDLFRADHLHLGYVGKSSFYGWLALNAPRHFPDELFREFYAEAGGRPSVPPSQLLVLVVLQGYSRVSDQEAVDRSGYDLRWKVALGLDDHEKLCAKSTLQLFRAKLLLHEKGREILRRSVAVCRESGVFRGRGQIRAAIDTTPVYGRGAVKDTFNLLADGIVKLLRALTACLELEAERSVPLAEFAAKNDFSRYVSKTSIKGSRDLDWDDRDQRDEFLTELAADVRRALRLARQVLEELPRVEALKAKKRLRGEKARKAVGDAISLLEGVLSQDVRQSEEGETIKRGVAKDRVPSVHDPEMRHGRKSKSTRFDGHKGEVVVDTESGVILEASVKPGNHADAAGSLEAIERAESVLKEVAADDEAGIEATYGDCAYGTAANLRDFEDAGRELLAKQPKLHNGGRFTKADFPKDAEGEARVCPAGHRALPVSRSRKWRGERVSVNVYRWDPNVCGACPLREQCLRPPKDPTSTKPRGRTVSEHPEEALLARARERSATLEFRQDYRARVTAEHRLARMVQLGARQARYVGRAKTELQWLLSAAIANLTAAFGGVADLLRTLLSVICATLSLRTQPEERQRHSGHLPRGLSCRGPWSVNTVRDWPPRARQARQTPRCRPVL